MNGATDLDEMLRTLEIERRPGVFGYASIPSGAVPAGLRPAALVEEAEGTTLVAEVGASAGGRSRAALRGSLADPEGALLTRGGGADRGPESPGSTAAGVPANVFAGAFHDHVLVPVADAERAVEALLGT